VETNTIQVPLYSSDPQIPPGTSNSAFLSDFLVKLMKSAFPHLAQYIPIHCLCANQSVQIQTFVNGLFTLHGDQTRFKINVRDFLIELKEFAGQDNAELYLEEREASLLGGEFAQRNGVSSSNGGKSMEDD
jgi:exportin-1